MTRPTEERPGAAVPFILAACTGVSILSTDLITPSIPDLPADLQTTPQMAQLTVGVNLAAYSAAQLIHGPVADAVGRKRLLLAAFAAFATISVLCALASDIDALLTGRFLQGLFSSVPSVVIILIIRELYDDVRALTVMAVYGATLGIAPAIGPLIGGYLHVWFGWSAGFWFLAAVTIIVSIAVMKLVPETLPERKPLRVGRAIRDYRELLGNSCYLRLVIGIALCFGAFFAYVTTAPLVFIDLIGIPTQRFGLTNLVVVGAFITGNVLATQLRGRFELATIVRTGGVGSALAIVGLLIPILLGILSIPLILAAMAVFGLCLAFILAAGPLVVLKAAEHHPQGAASALLGSAQLGAASLAGGLSAVLFDGTAIPMVLVMLMASGTGAALLMAGRIRLPEPRAVPGSDPVD